MPSEGGLPSQKGLYSERGLLPSGRGGLPGYDIVGSRPPCEQNDRQV